MPESKNQPIIDDSDSLVKAHSQSELRLQLLAKARKLPKDAGCYIMKNLYDEIIYIGKAKNLKNRVISYFNDSAKSPKTQILVSRITTFEFILTQTESQSLILENNLIKKYRPKYNIRLKDDKSYPYISVDMSHEFPYLQYVRRPRKKKNVQLFGPYPSGFNISGAMKAATKAFNLRDCKDTEFSSRKEPCILYQMKHCSAPCVSYIDQSSYKQELEHALNLFRGIRLAKQSLKILEQRMQGYALEEKFEQAAMLRDQLETLNNFAYPQSSDSVEIVGGKDVDVVSFFRGKIETDISFYNMREGNLLAHKNFHFLNSDLDEDIEDEILNCIIQYYDDEIISKPQILIVDLKEDKRELLVNSMKEIGEQGVEVKVLSKSKKYDPLIKASLSHAKESQRHRIETQENEYVGLNKLKSLLGLKERPKILECYDIAIWQGKSPTASKIVFHEGKPEKSLYRYYHLTELPEGNNDFEMMREVFRRRLKHKELPDVFIVDGGVAQANTVRAVLKEFDVNVPVAGIAKSKNHLHKEGKTQERLFIENRSNPYTLKKCPSLFRILVQMRDEAHRFSRKLHHKKEKSRIITSWLDDVPGIGESTREKILRNLGINKNELRKMSVQKIKDYLGISLVHARSIYKFLHASE
jgi:excinuclease ABC subunit C